MSNNVVMCGCHYSGYESIRKILAQKIEISYFVLVPKNLADKNKISGYFDFEPLAKKHKIPIYYVKSYSLKNIDDIRFFKTKKFSLLIQGGWQRLFPKEILNSLKIGAVGGHGSSNFLPKGRGRSPLNWSLIENKKRFIIHYFIIKPGIDDGDIFHYEIFNINQYDDIYTLYLKISMITSKVLIDFIPKLLSGNFKVFPQKGKPSYYKKRVPQDGFINWENDIYKIHNQVRAVTRPYPGAFTFLGKEKVTIWRLRPFSSVIDNHKFDYGEIILKTPQNKLIVKAGGGLLLIDDYESNKLLSEGDIFKNEI